MSGFFKLANRRRDGSMSDASPLLCYFGSKFKNARKYPKPKYDHIIEPFAGGAGYSLNYYDRKITLVEKDERVYAALKCLIDGGSKVVLSLPLIKPFQNIDDLVLPDDHKWLIGFWLNTVCSAPKKTLAKWGREKPHSARHWSKQCRARLAYMADRISHWRIIHGSYEDAPNVEATWFIDPPYVVQGKAYRTSQVDFERLGLWCKNRQGQVIVCEGPGANWLPFKPFYEDHGCRAHAGQTYKEFIWESEWR